jgi:hypothetical protein
LIDIVERVHKVANLIHRDLSLYNFFLFKESDRKGKIFLNDWGCAAQKGKDTGFAGSLLLAPKRVLELILRNGNEFEYQPAEEDDWESIVKCVFWRLNPVFYQAPNPVTVTKEYYINEVKNLAKFWDEQLSPLIWDLLLKAARENNPKTLKALISQILA